MTVATRHMTIRILALMFALALSPGCGKDDNPAAPNNPPVITNIEVRLGSEVLSESNYSSLPAGQILTLTCTAEDADNDVLSTTWSVDQGTLDSIDLRCVSWTLPNANVSAELTVVVSDGEDTDSEIMQFTVIQAPSLSAGRVSPGNGHGGETFTYEVTFTDPTNQAPKIAQVFIDGAAQTMALISGNPASGSLYRFETAHEIGSHDFYFRFEDARDRVISFPDGAYEVGPLVTSADILVDEDVIVIDEQDGVTLETVVGSTYTFGFSGLPPRINQGDIILGTEPSGYLCRVISAAIVEDEIRVFTAPAALNEALITGSIDTSFVLRIDESALAGDVSQLPDGVQIDADRLRLENVLLFSGVEGSATVTASITQGEIAWEPDCSHRISLTDGALVNYTSAADGEIVFSCDASVETSDRVWLVLEEAAELAIFRYSRVHMLEWFPVCAEYTLNFTVGLRLHAEIGGTTTYGLEGTGDVELGAGYESDNEWWTVEVALPTSARHESSWDAHATTRITVSLNTAVGVRLYGLELSNLEANPFVRFNGEVTLDPLCRWNLVCGLPGTAEAHGAALDPDLAEINNSREIIRSYVPEDCYEVSLISADQSFGGSLDERAYSVVPTGDGGLVLTGYTASQGAGGLDVYLMKISETGSVAWERTFGGEADEAGHCVIATEDGGYAIAGYTFSFSEGEGDVYLIKTDANGIPDWQQRFGGALDDRGWCVIQTADGGYAIAGRARSWSGGVCDIYLIKTDENGELEWESTYGGTGSDRAYSMVRTPDLCYVLCGYTRSFGALGRAAYLIKFDENGDFVWDKVEDFTAGDDCANSVALAHDGSVVIAGSTPTEPFLCKFDASGNLLWGKTDLGGPSLDGANSVALMPDDGFLLGGFFYASPEGLPDGYVIKTDALGAIEWRYRLGTMGADSLLSVAPMGAGFVGVGSTTPLGGDADIYVVYGEEF